MVGERGVPPLLSLCLDAVERLLIINLDNALDVLQYGRTHDLFPLEQRASAFIRQSWAGIAKRHSADDLATVLGQATYEAMAKEAEEIKQTVDRLRLRGMVLDSPSPAAKDGTITVVAQTSIQPATRSTASTTPRRGWRPPVTAEKCVRCEKTVYAAERLSPAAGLVWHAPCFRCDQCSCKLNIQSYEFGAEGEPLCKPHFAQRRNALGGCIASPRVNSPRPAPADGIAAVTAGANGDGNALGGEALSSVAVAAHEATSRMILEHRRAWGGGHCFRCGRAVYAMERQLARTHRGDNMVFHKSCFRCEDCNTLLRADNWEVFGDALTLEAGGGALVCRVHFSARSQREPVT